MSDFVQVEPRPGQPATERTEVWVTFDDDESLPDGQGARQRHAAGGHRDAARQHHHVPGQRHRVVRARSVLRPAQRAQLHHQPHRRALGFAGDQRAAVQPGLEPGVDGEDRTVRRLLDGGSADSVQVDPLRRGPLPGVGLQRRAHQAIEERDVHAVAGAAGARQRVDGADVVRGDHGRARGAALGQPARHQALRHLQPEHQQVGDAPVSSTPPTPWRGST